MFCLVDRRAFARIKSINVGTRDVYYNTIRTSAFWVVDWQIANKKCDELLPPSDVATHANGVISPTCSLQLEAQDGDSTSKDKEKLTVGPA